MNGICYSEWELFSTWKHKLNGGEKKGHPYFISPLPFILLFRRFLIFFPTPLSLFDDGQIDRALEGRGLGGEEEVERGALTFPHTHSI